MGKISKKSRALYIGFLCLAFVLVASLSLGFTLAKYTKSVNNSAIQGDVAAFGVTLTAPTGDLFKKQYARTDTAAQYNTIANSVISSDNTFAPGTNNGTGYTFGYIVDGNEVLVSVDVTLSAILSNWAVDGAPYEPVKFTIKRDVVDTEGEAATTTYYDGDNWVGTATTVTVMEFAGEDIVDAKTFEADAEAYYSETYTITWEWAFEANEYVCVSAYDEVALGTVIDDAAYNALADGTVRAHYKSTNEMDTALGEADMKASITMTAGITAVQID